ALFVPAHQRYRHNAFGGGRRCTVRSAFFFSRGAGIMESTGCKSHIVSLRYRVRRLWPDGVSCVPQRMFTAHFGGRCARDLPGNSFVEKRWRSRTGNALNCGVSFSGWRQIPEDTMSYFRLPGTSKPRLLRFPLWVSMWLVALFTCAHCGISASGEKPAQELAKFALRDYLGREWQNELVFFKVDAALVGSKDAVLMDANGREIPYQWSTEDNGSIAFLASVPKFTRVEYKLVRGTPKTAPNLKVTQQPDSVEMVNDKTGIRVYRNSEALQRGPIAGVKLISGKWVGSGELTWPGPPMDFKTTSLTDGPLIADVESAYTSSTGDFWKLRFRIIACEPVILVDEEFSGPAQAYYQFNAVKDFGPDSLLWRAGPTATTNLWKNLTDEHAFTLEPWLRWASPMHGTWLAFYRDDSPDLLTIG